MVRRKLYEMAKLSPRHRFEEGWRKRFEKFAAYSNDDAQIAGWSTTGLETRLRYFFRLWEKIEHSPAELWLDLGCGAGTYSRFIAGQGMQVISLDYSYPTLQKAKGKGGDSIQWCAADATKLPIKPAIFDGVICFGVTQALENSNKVIGELAQAAKPGGQIWVDALNGWCLLHWWAYFASKLRGKPIYLRYESHRNIQAIMKATGLTEIRLFWLPILPTRWARFQWLLETPIAKWIFRVVPGVGTLFSHAFIVCGKRS